MTHSLQKTEGFTNEQIQAIKNTVAKDANTDELHMYLALANKYKLDPFAKEIWFTKYKERTSITISRDGYLKIAQGHPDFEGLTSFPVRSNDDFEIDIENYRVKHKMNFMDRGKLVGAWAKCERKGRKPVLCYIEFSEYEKPAIDKYGNKTVWGQYPSAMIQKVAEVFSLKRQFGINGVETLEEIENQEILSTRKQIDFADTENTKPEMITLAQTKKLKALWNEYVKETNTDKDKAEMIYRATLQKFTNEITNGQTQKSSSTELTKLEAMKFIDRLEKTVRGLKNDGKETEEIVSMGGEVFDEKESQDELKYSSYEEFNQTDK